MAYLKSFRRCNCVFIDLEISYDIELTINIYIISGVVVKRPPRVQEVGGSIPGLVILRTLKMVVMAALIRV